MKTFAISGLVLATATLSLSALVHAGEAPTMTVKYADLDLTRSEGAATLYARLTRAAHVVCGPIEPQSLDPTLKPRYYACISKAIAEAVAKVDRPALTEYASAKSAAPAIKVASR